MNFVVGTPSEDDSSGHFPLKNFQSNELTKQDVEQGFEIDESPSNSIFAPLGEVPPMCVLQVTIRKPLTPLSTAAITWSLFPYAVPIFCVLSFIRHAALAVRSGNSVTSGSSGFLLFYICFAIFGVLLNEKVLKRIIQEPRPSASACKGYGMPSGHSTNCYAWMVWTIVEIIVKPCASLFLTIFLLCLTVLVLGPVPYARVYLQDHTPRQVLVGMTVGTILGLLAAPFRHILLPHATPLWVDVAY